MGVSQVHPTLLAPIRAIFFVCFFDILLQLVALNTDGLTAFYSITGLTTVGFQISYAIPIGKFVVLCAFSSSPQQSTALKVLFKPKDFPKTPLSLGRFSLPVGVISSTWLCGTSIIMFFPTLWPGMAGLLLSTRFRFLKSSPIPSDSGKHELALCRRDHRTDLWISQLDLQFSIQF
jgi:hypothetical protein